MSLVSIGFVEAIDLQHFGPRDNVRLRLEFRFPLRAMQYVQLRPGSMLLVETRDGSLLIEPRGRPNHDYHEVHDHNGEVVAIARHDASYGDPLFLADLERAAMGFVGDYVAPVLPDAVRAPSLLPKDLIPRLERAKTDKIRARVRELVHGKK